MMVDNFHTPYQDLLINFANCFGELGVLLRDYHIVLKDMLSLLLFYQGRFQQN